MRCRAFHPLTLENFPLALHSPAVVWSPDALMHILLQSLASLFWKDHSGEQGMFKYEVMYDDLQ